MKSNNVIYTPSGSYTSLYRTSSAGTSWETTTDLNFGVSGSYFPDMDYTDHNILFATEKGLYSSVNQGGAWTKISALPSAQLLISASGTMVVAATTNVDRLYISYDSGSNWEALSKEGLTTFVSNSGMGDVVICNRSIFIYSALQKKLFRYRLNF